MIIKKYGDITKVGRGERVKGKCKSCGTVVILDKDEYKRQPIKCYWSDDFFIPHIKIVGEYIFWSCPMCNSSCYKKKWFPFAWAYKCEVKINGGYIK